MLFSDHVARADGQGGGRGVVRLLAAVDPLAGALPGAGDVGLLPGAGRARPLARQAHQQGRDQHRGAHQQVPSQVE